MKAKKMFKFAVFSLYIEIIFLVVAFALIFIDSKSFAVWLFLIIENIFINIPVSYRLIKKCENWEKGTDLVPPQGHRTEDGSVSSD